MSGRVYFLTDGELIKVGFATDIGKRIEAIQCGNGRRISCLASAPGTIKLERRLHGVLPNRRVGEWFEPSAKLYRLIRDINRASEGELARCIPSFLAAEVAKRRRWMAAHKMRGDRMALRVRNELCAFISKIAQEYGVKQLAKAIHVTEGAIRFWISGHSCPSALAVVRLGVYFPDQIQDIHRPLGAPRGEALGIAA